MIFVMIVVMIGINFCLDFFLDITVLHIPAVVTTIAIKCIGRIFIISFVKLSLV